MNRSFTAIPIILFLSLIANYTLAQDTTGKTEHLKKHIAIAVDAEAKSILPKVSVPDSLTQKAKALSRRQIRFNKRLAEQKAKQILGSVPLKQKLNDMLPDTTGAKKAIGEAGNALLPAAANKFQDADKLKDGLSAKAGSAVNSFESSLKNDLNVVDKKSITVDLAIESKLQYQPGDPITNMVFRPRYATVYGVNGTVMAFGIPFNVAFTSNSRSTSGLGGDPNNLFKFALDPKQLTNTFQSDLQKAYELRKNVFEGADLTGYTSKLINKQLSTSAAGLPGPASLNDGLSWYLNKPDELNKLLVAKPGDIRKKLLSEVAKEQFAIKDKAIAAATDKQNILNSLKGNPELAAYLAVPANKQALSNMTNEQILRTLQPMLAKKGDKGIELVSDPLTKRDTVLRDVLTDVTRAMVSESLDSNADLISVLAQKDQGYSAQIQQLKNAPIGNVDHHTLAQIDSVTAIIGQLQTQLGNKGYDVGKLLAMHSLMSKGTVGDITEQERDIITRKGDKVQGFVSRFADIKIGSFGNNAPGSTQGQDLFVDGAHATFKLGYTPVTVGYGSQNDVRSLKDADFQNSVFNSPRNITYLGTEIKRSRLKISVIGAVNKQTNSYLNAMPTISSNNVAVTMSKHLKLGNAGESTIDVSKTTTLYANNYVQGAEAVLNRRAGINDTGSDLFQTLSFGLSHRLDMPSIGMTDNFYVSYSGLGYQNPGNNGAGGAQFKIGGNLKKAFKKNKLVVDLRTDLKNQGINATSNDHWQNLQFSIGGRYVISKRLNVNLRYTNNLTDKKLGSVTTPMYSFQKIQAGGNASYKIGKNFSVSNFTVSRQSLNNSYQAATGADIMMMNYTQSLIIRQKTLTMNVFYNKELSATKLIGNMFNSDISCQFLLGKKVSIMSGLTFLENAGVARQAGIKEGIQLMLGRFDIGSNIDLRKDLITSQYPDLYAATRAEFSLRYYLTY